MYKGLAQLNEKSVEYYLCQRGYLINPEAIYAYIRRDIHLFILWHIKIYFFQTPKEHLDRT